MICHLFVFRVLVVLCYTAVFKIFSKSNMIFVEKNEKVVLFGEFKDILQWMLSHDHLYCFVFVYFGQSHFSVLTLWQIQSYIVQVNKFKVKGLKKLETEPLQPSIEHLIINHAPAYQRSLIIDANHVQCLLCELELKAKTLNSIKNRGYCHGILITQKDDGMSMSIQYTIIKINDTMHGMFAYIFKRN